MALPSPKGLYGVHSVAFYNRTTGVPFAIARVIGEMNSEFTAEFEDLLGGSNLYPWDTEIKSINSDISFSAREYTEKIMETLLGGTLTEIDAETSGNISTPENVNGNSVIDNVTGIASISAISGSESDLKAGKYIIQANDEGDEVDIYALSDVDFKTGTDKTYQDKTMKINDTPITVVDDSSAPVSGFGFQLNGGSGTIAMDEDDSAEFYVRKVNTGGFELVFGESGAEFSEFGLILAGQRMADGTINYMEFYRVKGAGMPINFAEKAWSEFSATLKALYDSDRNAVGKFYTVKG
jgi:hypothetical protein